MAFLLCFSCVSHGFSSNCWEALIKFVHLNGFSSVWVILCSFKWPAIEKILSRFEQLKGFSSVWVLSCSFKELDLEKNLSHFVHLNGFSPVSPSNLMVRSSCHNFWTWMESLLSGFPYVPSSSQLLRSNCWQTLGIEKASGVGPLMFLQVACLGECLITIGAFEYRFFCESPLMSLSGLILRRAWYTSCI